MRRHATACFLLSGLLAGPLAARADEEPPPYTGGELPLPEGVVDPVAEPQPDCVDDGEGGCVEEELTEQPVDPEAYSDFEQTLAPYGSWSETEEYGQVWFPSADVVGA